MSTLRPGPILVAAALLLAAAASPPLGAQQPSFGPLGYEEGSPLQRLAFTPSMESAGVVGEGAWSVELYNGYSNIFEQDSASTHVLFLDMERLTTAMTVRWGASETLELSGRVALETTGAGALDGFVLGWHERFGFGNANRDRFPSDDYRQWLADGDDAVYLDEEARTLGLRDVRGSGKWRAWSSADGRSLLSLRSVVRVSAVGPRDGDPRIDGALMALWRLGMGDWYAHGLFGVSATPPTERLDPVLRGHSRFLALAVERSLGSSVAALAQIQMQTAALRSFDHREIDRGPTNVLIGLAGRVGESWNWNASFQEDVPADTPAVDFTVTLRVARRW